MEIHTNPCPICGSTLIHKLCSDQAGPVEGISAEQFHKVNLDTWGIYRWQYDSALFRFAESYAALKVREATQRASTAEDDLMGISRALNQPGTHVLTIAERTVAELAKLREELAALKRANEELGKSYTELHVECERAESALAEAQKEIVKLRDDARLAINHANRRDHPYTEWCDGCNHPTFKEQS